ncbi:MAG: hypothetical protein H6730_10605 [Deltaproteobacteria bacterium]|nr:hypothetical protein [Deltaproteobacteria bacterium]
MKKSPMQTVKDKFGGRADLVAKLVPMVDKMHGDDSDDAVRSRLMGLTNQKLLRLYAVEQKVRERFGDKDKLVQHILDARKTAGHTADETYKAKISGYSKAKLLDLSKQNLGPRQVKLTPEQRMAAKRGKKQIARAKAKIG